MSAFQLLRVRVMCLFSVAPDGGTRWVEVGSWRLRFPAKQTVSRVQEVWY